MNRQPGRDRDGDDGMVLILTLLLTALLAVVVMAIATYTTVGLRTARVATARSDGNAAASAAITWSIEQLAAKRLDPTSCDGGALVPPAGLLPTGELVEVSCTKIGDVNATPTVRIVATARSAGAPVTVQATVQVPPREYGAVVADWSAFEWVDPAAPSGG